MATRRANIPVVSVLALLVALVCIAFGKSAFDTASTSTSRTHAHLRHPELRRHRRLGEEDSDDSAHPPASASTVPTTRLAAADGFSGSAVGEGGGGGGRDGGGGSIGWRAPRESSSEQGVATLPENGGAVITRADSRGDTPLHESVSSRKEDPPTQSMAAAPVMSPIVLTSRHGCSLEQLDLAYSNKTRFRHHGGCLQVYQVHGGSRHYNSDSPHALHSPLRHAISLRTFPHGGQGGTPSHNHTAAHMETTHGPNCSYYGFPYHYPPPLPPPTIGFGRDSIPRIEAQFRIKISCS
jgi:hypothetical protein